MQFANTFDATWRKCIKKTLALSLDSMSPVRLTFPIWTYIAQTAIVIFLPTVMQITLIQNEYITKLYWFAQASLHTSDEINKLCIPCPAHDMSVTPTQAAYGWREGLTTFLSSGIIRENIRNAHCIPVRSNLYQNVQTHETWYIQSVNEPSPFVTFTAHFAEIFCFTCDSTCVNVHWLT